MEDELGRGLGCYVRNSEGTMLFALVSFRVSSISVILAELEAIVVSLASAINLGYSRIVESDSKGAIDVIMSGDQFFKEFGSVLEDMASFALRVDVVFSFVPRVCNQVTNELARHARVSSSSESYDSLFPNWLLDLVSRHF